MIVECAHCRTRFQLDDTRVPAAGVQVRCSRCKHAFFLKPSSETRSDEPTQVKSAEPSAEEQGARAAPAAPSASPERESHESEPPAPESEAPTAEFFDFGGGANPDHDAPEEESDWEFNTDFPEEEDVTAPSLGAAARAPASEQESLSLDDVGSPEEWNLIGEDAEDPLEAARAPAAPARAPAVSLPAAAQTPRAVRREPAQGSTAPPTRRPSGAPPLLGWSLTALLLLLVAHGGLRVSAQRSDSAREGTPVAGLVAEDLRGRRVENAWGPTLYVVSGRLRNPDSAVRSPGALVAVRLARANGIPIPGLRAPAGGALAPDVLREAPPEQIRTWQQRSARRIARLPIAPGESIRFDAVFEELPAEAALVELESSMWTESAPLSPAEAEQEEAPEMTATTSSSPPSAPPSSE